MRILGAIFWLCGCVILIVIAAFMISDEAFADLKDDLVSVWKFDEGNGDAANDSVGNNDGIIDGAEWVEGKFGMALDFNGVDAGVEIPDDPSLQLPDAMTISCWVYPRATKDAAGNDHAGVVWKGSLIGWGTDVYNWRIATSGDAGLTFGTCGGGVESHFNDANCFVNGLEDWYHVAFTADGTIGIAYVNGIEINSRADAITYDTLPDQPVRIGWAEGRGGMGGASVYFNGIIDDVAIYSRALDENEIRELMEEGTPGSGIPSQPEQPEQPDEPGVPSGNYAATWGAAKNYTSVYIQEQYVDVNTEFSVDIRIGRAKDLAGFQLSLNYEPYNLTFIEAQEGSVFSGDGSASFWRNPDVIAEEGNIVGVASTRTETGGLDIEDDILVTLMFQAKELGRSMITLQDVKLSDPKGELLPHVAVSAFIAISPSWDIVRDSIIDIRDMVAISQSIANPQLSALLTPQDEIELATDIETYDPDADRNGVVDVDDLILVSSHLGEIYQGASVSQQSSMAQLRILHSKVSAAPYKSPEVKRLEAHLMHLIIMDRTVSSTAKSRLLPNYPNPFNPSTWIPYQLAQASDVTINIYTISGKLIQTLDIGYKQSGYYTGKEKAAYWDGSNRMGENAASGSYFYVIRAGDFTETRKMLLKK